MGKKGGKALGVKKKAQKRQKEILENLFSIELGDAQKAQLEKLGFDPEGADHETWLVANMYNKACKGNASAIKYITALQGGFTSDLEAQQLKHDKERIKLEKERLELERKRVELQEEKQSPNTVLVQDWGMFKDLFKEDSNETTTD